MRHVFIEAAAGGAVIMFLATIGVLVFAWVSRPGAGPRRLAVREPKVRAVPQPKVRAVRRPEKPSKPAKPAKPAKAAKPAKPAKPAKTEKPAKRAAVAPVRPTVVARAQASAKAQVSPEPKAHLALVTEPDHDGPLSKTASYPSWMADIADLGDEGSAPQESAAAGSDPAAGDFADGNDYAVDSGEFAAPSWLGITDPLDETDTADAGLSTEPAQAAVTEPAVSLAPVHQVATAGPAPVRDDESAWPDFLALPDEDAEQVEPLSSVPGPAGTDWLDYVDEPEGTDEIPEPWEPAEVIEPAKVDEPAELGVLADQAATQSDVPQGAEPQDQGTGPLDHDELAGSVFSPAALRMLGAKPLPQPGEDIPPGQRHQVVLGDDQIEVTLVGAAADGLPDSHLAWTPLPYDIPDDGLAFACVGAGDDGCLFIDLAAAPGAVAISGDPDAAVRLAESIAHQLCATASAEQSVSVLLVGQVIPEPYPASAISVDSLRDLTSTGLDGNPGSTDIIFCELHSDEDAFALARHVASAQGRVIPVVLGSLPGAAWSLTASPDPMSEDSLPSLASSLAF